MAKSIPELSSDTRVLAARLCKLEPGETIEYHELNSLVAGDVQTNKRGNLMSACRVVSREHGIPIATVRKVGVKRLLPSELPSIGDQTGTRIGKIARRGVKRMLEGASRNHLDAQTRSAMNARVSVLGAIASVSSNKGIQRVEREIANTKSQTELPLNRTLAVFAGE